MLAWWHCDVVEQASLFNILHLYSPIQPSVTVALAIPGLPLLGNLLQLKERKPYLTFAKWAEVYGPIYSIRLGSTSMVVLNSTEIAKEALVTKFSSISTRKLSNALTTITSNKALVSTCDYGEYHKMVKKYVISGVLGANAQKRNLHHRNTMIENVVSKLSAKINDEDCSLVELREPFQSELFQLALKQSLGNAVDSIYVEELGQTILKKEMLEILVLDPLIGVIEVDWRDFFPYLRWIPNKSMEMKIQRTAKRKTAVTKALINLQKERIGRGEEISCYLDYLLSEETTLTEDQFIALIWEAIVESSDTTMVVTEWAMYEIAKNPTKQDRLYQEIRKVCGMKKITEEHLPYLQYLNAAFHETLRLHPPVPIIPPRHVHEDTQLGGYNIPAGTDITINLYACNMDKKDWDEPEKWKPERFLSDKYEPMDMHKTMAFGGGKRVCAGSLQAMLISCRTIGRLIQEFEWKLKDGEEDNIDTLGLTTHKLHPMQAQIRPRSSCGLVENLLL
ncbi:ent-kaurene oxidase, chloroplastic [Dendrobium catenatum]|uniref:ent-kaurene oxidase, chloroplastic n=1 Tax=Dendrobium catenatum TaxID=906689 RepID=UPI00109F7C2B|nr:ent-kaurene oxidase, chloroplastic [Dendrobium catenatum]